MEKDAHHEEAVLSAGGIFIPLAVKSLGHPNIKKKKSGLATPDYNLFTA